MEKAHNPASINKFRDLSKKLISLLKTFRPKEIKAKPANTKATNKAENKSPPPSAIAQQNKQSAKALDTRETTAKILSCLTEGKTKQALKENQFNKQNKKACKSRFLNGLNCAEKNKRKMLWISSFHDGIQIKSNQNLETCIQFTPFQYWSQGQLPQDLKAIQQKWNKILLDLGLPAIKIFNKSSAREWIKSYTPEFIDHFDQSPLYAVEADIFRIAFALKNDCIWIDSDQYPRQNTGSLIQQRGKDCDTLLMFRWNRPWITNSFFMTKKFSPLFQKIFGESLNYEFPKSIKMTRNDVLRSFGPGRYNTILNKIIRDNSIQTISKPNNVTTPQLISRDGWRYAFLNEKNLSSLKPPFKLSYESSADSWHNNVK